MDLLRHMGVCPSEIVTPGCDLAEAISKAALKGYSFTPRAINLLACKAMELETDLLCMEEGDHVAHPINSGSLKEVRQLHERVYAAVGDEDIAVASAISQALIKEARRVCPPLWSQVLNKWAPTEAGYQRYRTASDHISPHRDRKTDQLLGATITINGAAVVKIHKPLGDPDDYSNLELVDEFETGRGSLMLLRASGLGSGEQVIHEVLPPCRSSRLILNLRMRPDVLKAPGEEL